MPDNPTPSPMALLRFQAISAYLALDPPRGKRRPTLRNLAQKTWILPNGRQVRFTWETLRVWVRRYRKGGLAALEDRPHPQRGIQVLSPEQVELVCQLKREVPERSLDRLLLILEDMDFIEPGSVSRSTLHRVLRRRGLSGRPKPAASVTDLDRFEAEAPNDLWQSDALAGPWLDDPARSGKKRRAWLYAFIDDHSRLLVAGRFSFKGDLPALELVFRDAIRRHGLPRRVYYDNGKTYRSRHMRQVVATLGIHGIAFTTPYRPEGHGKIEALNRLIRSAFVAEVKASTISTLDELNAAFVAWTDRFYNRRPHGETGEPPRDRWRRALDHVRHVDEEQLRQAFLWTETRTPDKAGVFRLHGRRYQAGPDLARKKIAVRYDPEHLDEVEAWLGGAFRERVRPFKVHAHRRPSATAGEPLDGAKPTAPVANWLGHLEQQRIESWVPDPEQELEQALRRRQEADDEVVTALRDRLAPDVFDEATVRRWLDRYGPLDAGPVAELLDFAIEHMGPSHHVDNYLDMLHAALFGGEA